MIKEERDRLFAQDGWSKNDVRLLLKYIEELEASRESRTLSEVPSEELAEYEAMKNNGNPMRQSNPYKSGFMNCYHWMIDKIN